MAARRDRIQNIETRQLPKKLDRAGERANLAGEWHDVVAVEFGTFPGLFGTEIGPALAEQGTDEEAAAHLDPAVDATDIERDSGRPPAPVARRVYGAP